MLSLHQLIGTLNQMWPRSLAEEWDQVGLVLGHPEASVTTALLCVDVVDQTVTEAIDQGVDVIIAHHPLLLRGVTSLAEDQSKGHLVARLIRGGVALFTAHTNADAVDGGTSETLGRALGLKNMEVIAPSSEPPMGIGRVGVLATPTRLYDLASQLGGLVPQTAAGIKVSGDPEQLVTRVALCTGAGDSLLGHPQVASADVYITGDLRHHPASDTQQARLLGHGPALIDVSHFASEWFFLDSVKRSLEASVPQLDVVVSELVTDPWDFVVHPGMHTPAASEADAS